MSSLKADIQHDLTVFSSIEKMQENPYDLVTDYLDQMAIYFKPDADLEKQRLINYDESNEITLDTEVGNLNIKVMRDESGMYQTDCTLD